MHGNKQDRRKYQAKTRDTDNKARRRNNIATTTTASNPLPPPLTSNSIEPPAPPSTPHTDHVASELQAASAVVLNAYRPSSRQSVVTPE